MFTYRSGVFVVIEIPNIGVLLKWDRGTRVYLKLENRWKGRVQGLCGNYNYDALDDFMNPSLGVENNPIIFGHSWKLDDSCAGELIIVFFFYKSRNFLEERNEDYLSKLRFFKYFLLF